MQGALTSSSVVLPRQHAAARLASRPRSSLMGAALQSKAPQVLLGGGAACTTWGVLYPARPICTLITGLPFTSSEDLATVSANW